MYYFTLRLSAFEPMSPAIQYLFATIAIQQDETDQFLSAFAGVIPMNAYLSVRRLLPLLGVRGVSGIVTATLRAWHERAGLRR
jgi:hypothetical protein